MIPVPVLVGLSVIAYWTPGRALPVELRRDRDVPVMLAVGSTPVWGRLTAAYLEQPDGSLERGAAVELPEGIGATAVRQAAKAGLERFSLLP